MPRSCLVTGGAGFIGSHLVESLLADGQRVTVVDNQSTGSIENLQHVRQHKDFRYVQGDIADESLMAELIAGADELFHLAAAVGVQLVASDPVRTIATNIAPTESLLRLCLSRHQAGQPIKVFLASTSEVYGKNPKPRWTEEDDLVFGPTTRLRWSYGASKAIDEFLALAYAKQFALPVVIGRFFNVVGPRQVGTYGMVLPRFVQAALRQEPLRVHDDGQQVRCFAYVSDVVQAVRDLMNCQAAEGQVVNIGSDIPISILELAEMVIRLAESTSIVDFQSYSQAYGKDFEDIRHRVPDLSRLRDLIGYQPQHDLESIIRNVIADHRNQAG